MGEKVLKVLDAQAGNFLRLFVIRLGVNVSHLLFLRRHENDLTRLVISIVLAKHNTSA